MATNKKRYYNPRKAHVHEYNALKARVAAWGRPCALCGRPIDYTLPAGDPWAYELDHITPLALIPPQYRERAALDPNNVQPAHAICNRKRGAKPLQSPKVRALGGVQGSEDWIGGPKGQAGTPHAALPEELGPRSKDSGLFSTLEI